MILAMAGERRIVAVLFTDLVGSTAQLSELGPEARERVLGRHFAGLRDALAVHRGREVKALGDGIMAVFDSVSSAVACAITMQRTVARHNQSLEDRRLAMRIGLSVGEVSLETGDVFGTSVIESSRLCALASDGQILIAEIARLLMGDGIARLSPVGELELKGLPRPVLAWNVDWDQAEAFGLRVALADDSALLRQGIAQVLETEGIDVVAQASDADELLRLLVPSRPHVVVLDVRMPPTHTTEGLDAAARIREEHPEIGVLVLSASVDPSAASRLLESVSGGVGYLLKDRVADVAELTAAIRTVASGGSAIDPEVIARFAA
jgi:class 3 adenylate cyclase/ActR/RegA family two-component response regulator